MSLPQEVQLPLGNSVILRDLQALSDNVRTHDLTLIEALMTQLHQATSPKHLKEPCCPSSPAVLFGLVLSRNKLKAVTEVVRNLNVAFMVLIDWAIKCTFGAICSLLAAAIANLQDLIALVKDVLHVLVFCPILLRFFVNINPYQWMAKMTQAQLFAMGCASSAATLPVAMECNAATNVIPQEIYHFKLSLDATIGMDGTAAGTPIAIVFMAQVSDV